MIALLLLLALVAIYFYCVRNHDYWSKRNVKHDPPIPLFGNHLRNQLGYKSMTQITVELYKKFPGVKVIGYYHGRTPVLIIKDLDLVKNILTADFSYFYQRGLGRDPKLEPLLSSLFHLEGDQWRLVRHRMTPAFTIAKLRAMFPLLVKCAERLHAVVTTLTENNATYDARELMARFTTDFIGACGFGIEMDSMNNEHSQFREVGKLMFARSLRSLILLPLWELFPELRRFLRIETETVEKAMVGLVEQIRRQRGYKPIGRHDFIDLLLELDAKGKICGESIERVNEDGSPVPVEMEMDLMCQVAQVYIFFGAGFETSSSSTSYTLHMLAYNQDVQKKVQDEIDSVMVKYNNSLCYDAIADMTLLDMAFKEAMRIFPSLGVLNRTCTRRYTIPGTDITIDPGVEIMIPVQAIQMDEKYFPEPEEFRPERFTPEAIKERHNYAYLPFGEGPRACIGARLGQMQSLAGLATILHKFSVEPAGITKRHPRLNPLSSVVQTVEGGLPLVFKKRNHVI